MFEKLSAQNEETFRRRYVGTYGTFVQKDKKTLCRIVSSDRDFVVFEDKDGDTYNIRTNTTEDVGFLFMPPRSGYHQYGKELFYVERVLARQYQRGLSDANTTISLCGGYKRTFNTMPVSFEYVEKLSNEKEIPINITAWAISTVFAIIDGSFFLYEKKIGKVTQKDNRWEFVFEDPSYKNLFREELHSALTRKHIPFVIV